MKTKSFTSEDVAKWMVTFYTYNSKEEYNSQLNAIRCMFGADNDPEFWNEVCAKVNELLSNKQR